MTIFNLGDPELARADRRDRFELLSGAVQAFLNAETENSDHKSQEIISAARLLRLLLDRKLTRGYLLASQSPSVVEYLVDSVLWHTLGRHL